MRATVAAARSAVAAATLTAVAAAGLWALTPAPVAAAEPGEAPSTISAPVPEAPTATAIPHALELNSRAQLVHYPTTRADGSRTTATATLFEPTAPWAGPGPRPTIVLAPGTRGQGDQCAPSRAYLGLASATPGSLNVNYEYQFQQAAAAFGIRVIVPDYIGLGTPGHHTYVHAAEQAYALIDAARAALTLTGAPADAPIGFAGYSQGGGAAASAAERVAEYAPELNIKGTFAGAPPADLSQVMVAVDGSPIAHVLGYAINGFGERDPRFLQLIMDNFNERGHEFVRSAANSCIPESVLNWGGVNSRQLTRTGESFAELSHRIPEIARVLDEQQLGRRPVSAPIYIAHSPHDDLIPFAQAQQLAGAYCQQGGTVDFVIENGPGLGWGTGHALPLMTTLPKGLIYLADRFHNRPAPSNCING